MRKIEVTKWKEHLPDGEGNLVENDVDLLIAINMLLSAKKPETLPRGLDKFRTFTRLGKAFDEAEKTGILTLEEADYVFLKKIIESDIPSTWGMNSDISTAFELFLNAEEVK